MSIRNQKNIENWLEPHAVARAAGMYLFLKISPSYALAHACKTNGISTNKQIELVCDLYKVNNSDPAFVQVMDGFEKVLTTYDVVGDVYKRHFDTWFIADKGYRLFGYEEAPPQAMHVASFKDEEPFTTKHSQLISKYFETTRPKNGNPPLHLISVPAGVGVSKQIELLKELLARLEAKSPSYTTSVPYFAFKGQRFRLDPIEKYLKTLTLRAISPNRPLWQLAAINELSNTIRFEDPWNEKPTNKNEDERSVLNSLAYRALTRAKKIAEHASQGVFPSHADVCVPKYDWEQVAKRINQQ